MDCETFKEVVGQLAEEHDAEPRRTEPWEEIVMTVLSQNTADENRDRAYDALVEHYETPDEILNAPEDRLRELIAPAGLANSKASYLKNAARHVVEEHGGETDWVREESPEDVHDELMRIKGVGHKTADVILLFAADADYCPVDTHVDRVTGRLGVAPDMSPAKTREKLLGYREECGVELRKAHVALIAHGRATCHARLPECGECVVEDVCEKYGVEG
jgi:endonuclease-3